MGVESEPNRFLRHRSYEFWLDTNEDDELFIQDSSMTVRGGLDGTPGSISFESVNFPGHFLRHENYTCQLGELDGSETANKDASFVQISTQSGSVKLQSVNFTDHLLTHVDHRVRISAFDNIHEGNHSGAQWTPT